MRKGTSYEIICAYGSTPPWFPLENLYIVKYKLFSVTQIGHGQGCCIEITNRQITNRIKEMCNCGQIRIFFCGNSMSL